MQISRKARFDAIVLAVILTNCAPASKPDAIAAPIEAQMLKAEDPPAPDGWTAQPGVTATRYQDDAEPLNVFRLYQPAKTDLDTKAWFEGRRRTFPESVKKADPVDDILIESGFHTGYARGEKDGAPVAIISYACQAGGGIRFGELVTSQDEAIAAAANKITMQFMIDICRDAIVADAATAATVADEATDASEAESEKPAAATQVTKVAPGNALKNSDIQTVLYSWEDYYQGMTYKVREEAFLIMKDRSVREGIPSAAPADFDVAADRQKNPKQWGKWTKRGGEYEVSIGGAKAYVPPNQTERRAGKKGQRLDKEFTAYDSNYYGADEWSLHLRKDGTFRSSTSSFVSTSVGGGDPDLVINSGSDDKGGSTAISTPGVGGGTTTSTGVTDADLTGTYEIDGYTLTLKYRSGRVQRTFFFQRDDGKHIWFEGRELSVSALDD